MRRVVRSQLDPAVESKLRRRQAKANRQKASGTLNVSREWTNARRTQPLRVVEAVLKNMMGERERCMYCLDSHGTDIEHFWPKQPYPERMFDWANLLLGCTECGRLKGDRFPLISGRPALVDPTAEDPWQHLDFDPMTGNIVARFDVTTNDWSKKGLETVKLLQLDQREALSEGHKSTLRRLIKVVDEWSAGQACDARNLVQDLRDADEHGLLQWCFLESGQHVVPFSRLRTDHPHAWAACTASLPQR